MAPHLCAHCQHWKTNKKKVYIELEGNNGGERGKDLKGGINENRIEDKKIQSIQCWSYQEKIEVLHRKTQWAPADKAWVGPVGLGWSPTLSLLQLTHAVEACCSPVTSAWWKSTFSSPLTMSYYVLHTQIQDHDFPSIPRCATTGVYFCDICSTFTDLSFSSTRVLVTCSLWQAAKEGNILLCLHFIATSQTESLLHDSPIKKGNDKENQ